jgi:hypothetical protein
MLVTCKLEKPVEPGDFDPFPGGRKAKQMGCTCPYQPIEDGTVTFSSDCPVHELEKVLAN